MEYRLKHNSWFGGEPVIINVPDEWEVTYCGMEPDSREELTRDELKARIDSPEGSKTISELAKGKRDVAIIFDDMSRGTPCKDIAELIVEELHSAGIAKEQIRFICATGSHSACNRIDFEKSSGNILSKIMLYLTTIRFRIAAMWERRPAGLNFLSMRRLCGAI